MNLEEESRRSKEYYKENKNTVLEKQKKYRKNNKEKMSEYNKIYYQNNKEDCKEYQREYCKKKIQNDLIYKIRKYVSRSINQALKNWEGGKYGKSILSYLPYSILELKTHIENLFSSPQNLNKFNGTVWMNWKNWGQYLKNEWDDNDPSTWKWQLDHITPHSELPYINMEDENFTKAWSLSNLRPLNAKDNLLDGVNKTRHNKIGD